MYKYIYPTILQKIVKYIDRNRYIINLMYDILLYSNNRVHNNFHLGLFYIVECKIILDETIYFTFFLFLMN